MARTRVPRLHHETHVSARTGWLRAGVLGANDGLLSTASLIVGVAAADVSRSVLFAAGLAALLAGAFSMAVGEYSSVSSQRDAEEADLAKERSELAESPRGELAELQGIYIRRGLEPGLARQVAEQLTAHDALASHARDELGLDPGQLARPVQAAATSALSFSVGALVPLVTVMVASTRWRIPACVVVTLVCLSVLGAVGAEIGGASKPRASLRVLIGGAAAMAITYAIGHAVGVKV